MFTCDSGLNWTAGEFSTESGVSTATRPQQGRLGTSHADPTSSPGVSVAPAGSAHQWGKGCRAPDVGVVFVGWLSPCSSVLPPEGAKKRLFLVGWGARRCQLVSREDGSSLLPESMTLRTTQATSTRGPTQGRACAPHTSSGVRRRGPSARGLGRSWGVCGPRAEPCPTCALVTVPLFSRTSRGNTTWCHLKGFEFRLLFRKLNKKFSESKILREPLVRPWDPDLPM